MNKACYQTAPFILKYQENPKNFVHGLHNLSYRYTWTFNVYIYVYVICRSLFSNYALSCQISDLWTTEVLAFLLDTPNWSCNWCFIIFWFLAPKGPLLNMCYFLHQSLHLLKGKHELFSSIDQQQLNTERD